MQQSQQQQQQTPPPYPGMQQSQQQQQQRPWQTPQGPGQWDNQGNPQALQAQSWAKAQQETMAVNAMRQRIGHDSVDEETARRFLRARDWDFEKSAQLLYDFIQWKQTFGCPVNPRSCLPELLKGKTFIHGTDRNGNAVMYHFVRKQDPSVRDLQKAVRSIVFWAEQAEATSQTGKVTLIFVRAGSTTANSDVTLARAIAPILQNNFPERLDQVLVYPSGPGFRIAWSTFQWFVDPSTRKKVHPITQQYELTHYVSPDQLLVEFGGQDSFQFSPAAIPGINWWDLEPNQQQQQQQPPQGQASPNPNQHQYQQTGSPARTGPSKQQGWSPQPPPPPQQQQQQQYQYAPQQQQQPSPQQYPGYH
uniref:CRAL-TRIO domain-containing protein n=1 Tax=Octactis speculum TaxID=3111310 RepID=A0A7S2FW53_9STRA|mmetsp:Transcript_32856/g.44501  ORF Transcript_32856/g.44501 Transcript_32856/m.44501 type:complete len:362 (+) Transcript_32856:1048-2133(+)